MAINLMITFKTYTNRQRLDPTPYFTPW